VPSFVTSQLETIKLNSEEEDIVKWAAGSMYSAGSHTVGNHFHHPSASNQSIRILDRRYNVFLLFGNGSSPREAEGVFQ
jgi:hypothetical protein